MATQKPNIKSVIIWQEGETGENVGEPALLISPYSDCVSIQQGEDYININWQSLNEVIKHLKEMKKSSPVKK